jgi:DNA-3-methyladenine glycosylase I
MESHNLIRLAQKDQMEIIIVRVINMNRCPWCGNDELYVKYHDEEWGVPVHDDRKHFEFLVLESAQAGLNWLTVLRKRENYRAAYDNFDPIKVAQYDENKVLELMNNAGIIRNRRKIDASIGNAKEFLKIQEEYGSFDNYIWSFVDNKPVTNHWRDTSEVPATSPLSDEVSKDLKNRGFKFLGSTIVYAHLQATGVINDHLISCFRYNF